MPIIKKKHCLRDKVDKQRENKSRIIAVEKTEAIEVEDLNKENKKKASGWGCGMYELATYIHSEYRSIRRT